MSRLEGAIELFLGFGGDMGEFLGVGELSDDFSLDGVELTQSELRESIFEGASLTGRYMGDNAEAIMTLIEAWAENGPGYVGTGVFERDDLVIDFPDPE